MEEFPGAAEVAEVRKNRYDQLWESDKLHELCKITGPLYPFSGKVEWQAVEKLLQHLPVGIVDDFLKLEYVRLTIVLLLLAMLMTGLAGHTKTLLFLVCTRVAGMYRGPS